MSHEGLWLTLAALGAYHGLNPAMGWLFAVSQGMQHRSRRAVLRALLPIALGHELSIALVVAVALGAAAIVEPAALRIGAAASCSRSASSGSPSRARTRAGRRCASTAAS